MAKVIFVLYKRPYMSMDEFWRYWKRLTRRWWRRYPA